MDGKLMRDGPANGTVISGANIRLEYPEVDAVGPVFAIQNPMALRGASDHGLAEVVEDDPSSGQ